MIPPVVLYSCRKIWVRDLACKSDDREACRAVIAELLHWRKSMKNEALLLIESEDALVTLSEDELDDIHGGVLGVVMGIAAFGIAGYQAFTTEEERIRHRNAIRRAFTEPRRVAGRAFTESAKAVG
jgi:hypothetical protein